ncbi:MAG: phosphoenolpyruvate synthase [Patescibacteria group bacterium]
MISTQIQSIEPLILPLNEVGIGNVAIVGGKSASLGELIQNLSSRGIAVPGGFSTTAHAYKKFINEIEIRIRETLSGLDVNNVVVLKRKAEQVRNLILRTPFSAELQEAITESYLQMCSLYGENVDVAVRSSATAEDLPDASFAGQQDTFLNINGVEDVVKAVHKCFASLFTDRAISYRTIKGFDHFNIQIAVVIQKMVRSDLSCSGVAFSLDTESGFRDAVLITGSYGLGESVVQGSVNPDEYVVFKPKLKEGFEPIIKKTCGSKLVKMIYNKPGSKEKVKNVNVPKHEQVQFVLSDEEVLKLAKWVCVIEDHYKTPMDVEWAKDGVTGQLFIVQARPETVKSQTSATKLISYNLLTSGPLLCIGTAVGEKIGSGNAWVLNDYSDWSTFKKGNVLVATQTFPDLEPLMKLASAVVTDQGGRTCHSAIISREIGIPAVVGCGNATSMIKSGMPITVSCSEGEAGNVYEGLLNYDVEETELSNLPSTRTKVLMNVGNPTEALKLSMIPNDGVGLARSEFMIANQIKIHPLALLNYDKVTDQLTRYQIEELTVGYEEKSLYFIDKLALGVGMIGAAFYPNPVIVRLSDLKSNEYANLIGGRQFEPHEENPMIGWRGARRYYDPKYRDAFALECLAMKRVRDEMGLTNIIPMVPFCRTPEEGQKVIDEMARNGLVVGQNNLQVYCMCELPSNVFMAEEFLDVFDGFSIGSNDLTQLILGLDRDSELVSDLFDERNPAVKRAIEKVIQAAKKANKKIGICGQGPSDFPDFAEFLVSLGIDSISLNPDTVLKTRISISGVENSY